ncbi:GspM family type II secretion system protein LspM [Legionella maioricensis]|uniref:GspM family type II secretion system protein LspM n=1 Tax=Legionella maioricensis TaxID=2896528 RepID=A0A9X2CXM1_9GAMM|nr:GspM family type II secretion system protein LspM [Legionella maioricensis]MCL9686149.1 GspM family type II secretion system protein LspM [Legionella maioricensis]
MKHYLNTLNEREKWMVVIAAVCLFIYCYYLLLYAPLSNKVTQKTAQLNEKIETLAWMQKVKQQGLSSKTKQTVDNSQLLTLLATQLKDNSTLKFPYQLQQTGSGDIQLTFDAVPFKLFMGWLAKINDRYTITIKQFDVQHSEIPGITKLMIIISATS